MEKGRMAYRSRERVARILAHQEADRVPYRSIRIRAIKSFVNSMGMTPEHRAFCLEGDFAIVLIDHPGDGGLFEPYVGDIPENASVSCWGYCSIPQKTEHGWHAGYQHLHPLADLHSVEDLRNYPFPDFARSGADMGLEEKVRDLKAEGYTVLGQMSQTVLETAYIMRGLPQLMLDFYERPRYVDFLFQKIAEQRLFQARRYAEADVDILRIGDDIATQENLMVSLELYRERIKPLHASIVAAARAVNPDIQVKYHSDGNLTALLPDLIDIGVTIINPVQPECMDLLETKREFGRDLTLWGCMPVQSTFAYGSREDVLRHLRLLMEHIAPEGGFVAGFINFLATQKSLRNLGVFLEFFYEIGRYKQ
jgi:uroporphyrinogen decarboxylase